MVGCMAIHPCRIAFHRFGIASRCQPLPEFVVASFAIGMPFRSAVVPAEAGIHVASPENAVSRDWIPASAGTTASAGRANDANTPEFAILPFPSYSFPTRSRRRQMSSPGDPSASSPSVAGCGGIASTVSASLVWPARMGWFATVL